MGSVELKQIENLLRRIHAGIRLVLWIVIWTAIIWWLAWWIISSNAPRSSIEAETMIDQFNAELTIRSFRLHDVRTLLITQLGLFNSRLVFATDEKYGKFQIIYNQYVPHDFFYISKLKENRNGTIITQ